MLIILPAMPVHLQDAIITKVDLLRQQPEMGRKVPEFDLPYLRELIHKSIESFIKSLVQPRLMLLRFSTVRVICPNGFSMQNDQDVTTSLDFM